MTPEQFTAIARPIVLKRRNYNKIFCIGFNKTGTTTMEEVLRLYGFNLPNQQEQEIQLTKDCFSCEYAGLIKFARNYDAFQDLPFSQGDVFVAADALFPNSKFILTERNSEDWFRSITSFHKKIFKVDDMNSLTERDILKKFNYLYKGYMHAYKKRLLTNYVGNEAITDWSKLYNKEYYIKVYEERNNRIKQYFANAPDKLLVIDVTAEPTTEKICKFLNIPSDLVIDMLHLNKT
jgi:hypothetical protein